MIAQASIETGLHPSAFEGVMGAVLLDVLEARRRTDRQQAALAEARARAR